MCYNIVHRDLLEDAAAVRCSYLPYCRRYLLRFLLVMEPPCLLSKKVILLVVS